MSNTIYVLMILVHASIICGIAYYYRRQYRKSVQQNNRRIDRLVVQYHVDELENELVFLRKRNEILMNGLFPRGDVFAGNFIDQDPELHALAELMTILSQSSTASRSLLKTPTSYSAK